MNAHALHDGTPDLGNTGDTAGTELLRLARSSIEYGLIHEVPLPVDCDELPREFADPAATFTTLRFEGRLRGCCGTLEAVRPLAEDVTQKQLEMLRHWPDAECPPGDGGGIDSLRPDNRRAWLAEHPLPRTLPYYSLVTCPDPERVSSVLRPGSSKRWRDGGPNDGMVLVRDQAVPDSTWLACLNADHWAAAVPIARTHPTLAATFVTHNDYPREALLEAVLRFVEEDLDVGVSRAADGEP